VLGEAAAEGDAVKPTIFDNGIGFLFGATVNITGNGSSWRSPRKWVTCGLTFIPIRGTDVKSLLAEEAAAPFLQEEGQPFIINGE
jgi:hypothetical protein